MKTAEDWKDTIINCFCWGWYNSPYWDDDDLCEIIQAIRQEQREACAEAVGQELHDIEEQDQVTVLDIQNIILNASKED